MTPTSIWKCHKCPSHAKITFVEMAESGTPLCGNEDCDSHDGELTLVDTIPSNQPNRKPLTPQYFLTVRDQVAAITPMPILGYRKGREGRQDRVSYQTAMDQRNFAVDQMTYAILLSQGYRIPKTAGGEAQVLAHTPLHPHTKRLAFTIGRPR